VIAIRKLRTFWSLDPSARTLVREALLFPPAIWIAFRLKGVPWTQAWLRTWAGVGRSLAGPLEAAASIRQARLAQTRVKRNFRVAGTCLVRSLTLWAMLMRRGVVTELRVGVRRLEGKIEAHAWLEFAGVPINDEASLVGTYSAYDKPLAFDGWHNMK